MAYAPTALIFLDGRARLAAFTAVPSNRADDAFFGFCYIDIAPDRTRAQDTATVVRGVDLPIELVKEILLVAENDTKARAARICLAWSDVALDALWGHMDSILPFLHLMGSIKLNIEHGMVGPTKRASLHCI